MNCEESRDIILNKIGKTFGGIVFTAKTMPPHKKEELYLHWEKCAACRRLVQSKAEGSPSEN